MVAKEVFVELADYNTDHMSEAAVALVTDFARYSGIYGTEQWVGALMHLLRIIEGQKAERLSLSAEGIDLSFSGFSLPRPRVDGESTIIYESKEPRFVIEDKLDEILPRQRTRIARVTSEIAEEMKSVFHMRSEYPPHILTFPKDRFAHTSIYKTPVLS